MDCYSCSKCDKETSESQAFKQDLVCSCNGDLHRILADPDILELSARQKPLEAFDTDGTFLEWLLQQLEKPTRKVADIKRQLGVLKDKMVHRQKTIKDLDYNLVIAMVEHVHKRSQEKSCHSRASFKRFVGNLLRKHGDQKQGKKACNKRNAALV